MAAGWSSYYCTGLPECAFHSCFLGRPIVSLMCQRGARLPGSDKPSIAARLN
jgi:hypothetical protein